MMASLSYALKIGRSATLLAAATSHSLLRNYSKMTMFLPHRNFAIMDSGADEFVRGHVHPNGVAVITLDRPKALNAMNLGQFSTIIHNVDHLFFTVTSFLLIPFRVYKLLTNIFCFRIET